MSATLEEQMFGVGEDSFPCYILIITLESGEKQFWFKGNDIARFLEYSEPRKAIHAHVPPKYKRMWNEFGTETQNSINVPSKWQQKTVFISEPGLYSLLSRSNQPEAQKFSSWVFEDVLPSIRLRGFYAATKELQERLEAEHRNRELEVRKQLSLEYQTQLAEREKEIRSELDAKYSGEISKQNHALFCKDVFIDHLETLAIVNLDAKEKLHQFAVFYRLSGDLVFPHEYTFSRTQNRNRSESIRRILKKPNNDRYEIYSTTYEANPINIPNKIKELITRDNYRIVQNNTIICTLDPESMMRLIDRIDRAARK